LPQKCRCRGSTSVKARLGGWLTRLTACAASLPIDPAIPSEPLDSKTDNLTGMAYEPRRDLSRKPFSFAGGHRRVASPRFARPAAPHVDLLPNPYRIFPELWSDSWVVVDPLEASIKPLLDRRRPTPHRI
jgi:hypothetical protein